jgi:uncharacterized delta-60 repeat protein
MVIWRYNRDGTLDATFNGRGPTPGIVVHDNAAGKNKILRVADGNRPKTNIKSIIEKELLIGKELEKSLPTKVSDITLMELISGDDGGNSIYVDSSGKIYVTGYSFNSRSRNKDMTIWRYNSDGTLDTTFDVDGIVVYKSATGDDEGNSIYVDSEGKIYVTGFSYNSSGNEDMVIWRYNSSGTLDNTFGNNGIVVHHNAAGGDDIGISNHDEGKSIYVDSTGKIYVTGNSWNNTRDYDMVIWRYNSNGTLDNTFGNNGIVVHHNAARGNSYDKAKSMYVDSTSKIYVTCFSRNRSDNFDMVIWRYNSNGSLDRSFGTKGIVVHHNAAGGNSYDYGNSMYVDSTGKIYVTGYSFNGRDEDMVIWKYR